MCLDFFIAKKSEMGFKGDGRTFDPNAEPSQSRVQVVASGKGDITFAHVSGSCGALTGCHKAYPLHPWGNRIGTQKGSDGSFSIHVRAYNAAALGVAPGIDAVVNFHPDGNGGFTTSGDRDAMPSLGIYQRVDGQWQELPGGRRPEKGGLFLIPFMPNDKW